MIATNEKPEKPTDATCALVRNTLSRGGYVPEVATVLRYLFALHDAKPSPVAVPEDVLLDAKMVADPKSMYLPCVAERLARFVLSLVPAPKSVVKWRLTLDHNRNTVAELWVDERHMASVCRCVSGDMLQWQVIDTAVHTEPFADLAAAKARAEELCGVKKGAER